MRRAFAEAGLTPRCVAVVTKNGWYDPVLDQTVVWDRLRIRLALTSAQASQVCTGSLVCIASR